MVTPEKRAEHSGFLSGMADVPREENPYTTGSGSPSPTPVRQLAEAWWRGWDRAKAPAGASTEED